MILRAHLGTYLALEQYHFRNTDLRRDFSEIDRSLLGICESDLSKSRSVDLAARRVDDREKMQEVLQVHLKP